MHFTKYSRLLYDLLWCSVQPSHTAFLIWQFFFSKEFVLVSDLVTSPTHSVAFNIKFGSSLNIGNGKRICMGKSCWMASFSHTNPLNIFEIWTTTKFSVYLNELQTSNLAVLLIFFLLFHKDLRLGGSRDQVRFVVVYSVSFALTSWSPFWKPLELTCRREIHPFDRHISILSLAIHNTWFYRGLFTIPGDSNCWCLSISVRPR